MIELTSDPYVLKPRTAPITEADFREHLNINWCRGVLFNVVALKNSVSMVEYLNKINGKYSREGKEDIVSELEKLKNIFEMEMA